MAFEDWIVYNHGLNGSGGQPDVGTTTSYFGGSTALVMAGEVGHGVDASGLGASANVIPDTFSKGFLHGKLRTLINPVVSNPANHGILCMQSAEDMQGGMGSKGYALMLDSLLAAGKVILVRLNDGISASFGGDVLSTYSVMGSSVSGLWSENTVYGLELEWHVDTALGGIYLIGRFATQANFSDLITVVECLDATSHAQLTTVGEGLYANLSTEDDTMIVAFDNTRLVSMVPA